MDLTALHAHYPIMQITPCSWDLTGRQIEHRKVKSLIQGFKARGNRGCAQNQVSIKEMRSSVQKSERQLSQS